jgi:hypothetical protein
MSAVASFDTIQSKETGDFHTMTMLPHEERPAALATSKQ